MLNDDLLFLLVFVVLPTAVVVSGFWLFVVVRRLPRNVMRVEREPASKPKSTAQEVAETLDGAAEPDVVVLATIDPGLLRQQAPIDTSIEAPVESEHATVEWRREPADVDQQRQALEEISPLAADLLYSPHDAPQEASGGDTQTFEAVERSSVEANDDDELLPEPAVGQTEEIPTVEPAEASEHEPAPATPAEQIEAPEPGLEPESEPQPANRPGTDELRLPEWEIEDDELIAEAPEAPAAEIPTPELQVGDGEEDQIDASRSSDVETEAEDEDDESQTVERRRPDRKLIPGERSKDRPSRRGRHSGRRVPRLPRLRRDEGGM